jgi:RsiW-degrading membrane proteinase PrsW (M82 family)
MPPEMGRVVSIRWHCACGKSLKAPDNASGKRARCPACGEVNVVPAASADEELPMIPIEPDEAPQAAASAVARHDGVDDDYGREYELSDEPPPAPKGPRLVVRRAAQPAVDGFDDHGGGGEAFTPPAYAPRAATSDEEQDDDELPLARQNGGRSWRDFTYLALLLAMIPLVVSTFHPREGFEQRLERTVANHPEVKDKLVQLAVDGGSEDKLFRILPEHRFDGAFLPRDTAAHWLLGLVTAAGFFALMMVLFDRGSARAKNLLFTGVFTGTAGIVLLVVFQFVAEWTQGLWIRGRGILVLLFYVVKFIGYSYYAAENPENGFFASFFGYTCGVGLCEELVKALPLILLVNNLPERATWRTACLWGLASGFGFGVAEGIMYSGRYYNGIGTAEIYVVRFVSCVALHACWAAAVGIAMFAFRNEIAKSGGVGSTLGTIISLAAPCIILHGLYDTLLKKDMGQYALVVALVSVGYLVFLVEWGQFKEGRARRAAVA